MVVPQKGMESLTEAFIDGNHAKIVANFEQLGWYVVLLPENLTQDSFAIHVFETYWANQIANVGPEWCKENDCYFSELVGA